MRIPFISNLRPTKRLLNFLIAFFASGLLVGLIRIFSESETFINSSLSLWWFCVCVFLVWVVYDFFRRANEGSFNVTRQLPRSFSLNRKQEIKFEIINNSERDYKVSFSDGIPEQFETSIFPLEQTIGAEKKGIFEYSAIAKKRGLANFESAYVLVESPDGFWQSLLRLGQEDETKVYPDFTAISNSFVFGVEQAMRNMGAHIAKRKGDGMEFNQLREFREGDTLKQVDWKATARLGVPISREYQEEKDQNIVFLLDCSRRMRAVEDRLSYFDYALNALLMSSYIALDKGDAVGVMTFSGEPSWMSPIKGKTGINQILNHLYALSTSTQSSDYVEAAENLLLKHRKRSLIILITNVRDEDNQDLHKAVEILSAQHLVMVVALQESLLSHVNEMELKDQDDTMLYAGIKMFEKSRHKMLALLKARGVSVVDATHKNIHVKLVTEYLTLKRIGRI